MDFTLLQGVTPGVLLFSFAVAVLAGLVKGLVGFAMPMVLISGLGSVVSPELALAWLIFPTLVTNGWQALRQGFVAAWSSMIRFRVFLFVGLVFLVRGAQFVRILPGPSMLLIIGVPITIYASAMLMGKPLKLPPNPGVKTEVGVGTLAGFLGGLSGVWGPPTVALLTALNTEKTEQMRVQGVIYGLGAVALVGAHIGSGVLNIKTAPFSAILVLPALAGLWLGFRIQDRIDQTTFRRLTLIVLLIAGLNLIRRGLVGF